MSEERNESVMTDAGKRKNRLITFKVIFNAIVMFFGVILITAFLTIVQTNASLAKQRDNNDMALSEVVSILNKNADNADNLTAIYHEGNWKTLDDIDKLLNSGILAKIVNNEDAVRAEVFAELASPSDISYLYILDMSGKIVICPDESLFGLNPAATTHMTQENLNRIMNWCRDGGGSVSPVLVKNQHGTYYFYSKPYYYDNEQYALVLGVSTWVLDDRIDSLKEVSSVLSRMGVINDGFLFAIDRTDNLFLYYKTDDVLLTGQNAFNSGLNEKVLEDGYRGTQRILGEKYYCTSKSFGSNTVIVAAARSKDVTSRNKYVLLWSIMGFLLVMILSLVYAIIVRNDFIRNSVKTERILISKKAKKPLYFNKTVFAKVFPLVIIGVFAVFGITFYMQTLLEITEGVDKSNVILQEVTGRYDENQESQKVIEDYYNSRFLSAAKLFSVFVEETPEVFNAPSEHYHSVYDEKGNKQYILDDEGNLLKAVAYSPILQQICDDNQIKAVYIYNEDGHTIATNTGNWFFTLSLDEEDQSYPFRRVIEGKTDNYIQEAMTDDLGKHSQYFGIVQYYYTKTNEAGETVYVSRYEYEEACAAAGVSNVLSVGGITRHRSLLQIELDQQLVTRITGLSGADYILSTEMLSGGAIIMFDTTKDHLCVYSPVRASIGRTAAELGISNNAFSGNVYYGFNRINGVRYFQYFRYVNNYYIATAIPHASMFTSRMAISVITAGVCLVMITVLLMTISISSKKEEEVYDLLSAEEADGNLNSTIFNIILPSGRSASTTQASNRWNNQRIAWNERSPEMKLGVIVGWVFAIPMLYLVVSAIGINAISEDDSVIRYIISGGWDRSPNVFAFSACIMVITVAVIGIELLKIPVRQGTALLGTQGETLGHLFLSVVRYGGVIFAVFYCLYLLGIDSPNLLASAGILSLVIGLGAQSLIKDIIAGIFIVFESEFRVGDIVTINGFRGTVTDIGLRTTKISGGGNVKIFNNSEISGVLNMTKETSVASATIGLEYGQDVDYVDEVLKRELPKLREDNKAILDGPTNLGVSELAERRFTVTVIARCSEQNVREVNRYLNKALLQIFGRYEIRIANQPAVKKPESAAPAEPNKK